MASTRNTNWNNDADYRQRVTLPDLQAQQPDDWQTVAKSVGAFVSVDNIEPVDVKTPATGYRLNLNATQPLRWFVDKMKPPTATMDDYRFYDDTVLAEPATCYYLGDGIVATAAHVLAHRNGLPPIVPDQYYVVFGMTSEYGSPQNQTLPAAGIFIFDRVLYKQYSRGSPPEWDYCDWSLLKIRPKHPEIEPPRFPPPLRIMAPKASYLALEANPDIFAIGYPWGTSLKLGDVRRANVLRQQAKPPQAPLPQRELFTTYRVGNANNGTPLQYSFRHNNINHSGNSGGPLFIRSPNEPPMVIGSTVANGTVPPGQYWLARWQFALADVDGNDQAPKEVRLNMTTADRSTYNIATRTSMWYHLTDPNAMITATFQFTPAIGSSGYFTLYLRVLIPGTNGDVIARFRLYSSAAIAPSENPISTPKMKTTKKFIDVVRSAQIFADNVPRLRPCFIVGVEAAFTLTDPKTNSPVPLRSDGQLNLITMSVSGSPSVDPQSEVVIMRETTAKEANMPIDRPELLQLVWKASALQDEAGAVIV
ncbi:hypothetical protein LTR46_005091 [Exophiala xenobiotica]|nr:hypothetical protein LTR46_005091 [Exophiala xenobiotica]